MTRYLVGCDGSAGAAAALRWAAATAQQAGAEVCVVRAWVYPAGAALPSGPASLPDPEVVDAQLSAELDRWVDEVVSDRGVDVTRRVERGPATAVLLRLVTELEADLLVVGAEGADASSRLVLGSVTERCIEESTAPVVVVPEDGVDRWAPPTRLVVGFDGSASAERALAWAGEMAATVKAEVVVVLAAGFRMQADGPGEVVTSPPDEAVDELARSGEMLAAAGVDHRGRLESGDARAVLPAIADEEEASLVVVGSRGLGRLPRLLLGSVARYVVGHVSRPVAVVPDVDRAGLLRSS
jgi:nucleotide-binding universal stress UspA family protein